jgi:phage-related protein
MYRSLFLCFIQFIVQAALSLLISAVQLFSGVVHDAAQSIQATIEASVDAINATLQTTLGGINDILKIIGKSITIPTVAQPDLR